MAKEKAKVKNLRLSMTITKENVANVDGILPSILDTLVANIDSVKKYGDLHDINLAGITVHEFVDPHTLQFKDVNEVMLRVQAMKDEQESELEEIATVNPVDPEQFKLMFARDLEQEKEEVKRQIDNASDEVSNLEKAYFEYVGKLKDFNKQLTELENTTSEGKVPECFLNNPNYTVRNVRLQDNRISIITKPIILTDIRQGGNKPINLGRFLIDYRTDTLGVQIYPYFNNIKVRHYWHPHVSGGHVCWGNAMPKAKEYFNKGDHAGVLRIVLSLLSIYNAESPYITMATFKNGSTVCSNSFFIDYMNKKYGVKTMEVAKNYPVLFDDGYTLRRVLNNDLPFSSVTGLHKFLKSDVLNALRLEVTPQGTRENSSGQYIDSTHSYGYDFPEGHKRVMGLMDANTGKANVNIVSPTGEVIDTFKYVISNLSPLNLYLENTDKTTTLHEFLTTLKGRLENEATTNAATA